MRNEYIKHGEFLPKMLPAAIDNNPMGFYALYLGKKYAIHGTNLNGDGGIGLRITRGCIRLRSADIKKLYTLAPSGTRVQFINEPVKITTDENGLQYIEIHSPLSTIYNPDQSDQITKANLKQHVYKILKNIPNINYITVDKALSECSGIPVNITYK